jgi:hypothetical protein
VCTTILDVLIQLFTKHFFYRFTHAIKFSLCETSCANIYRISRCTRPIVFRNLWTFSNVFSFHIGLIDTYKQKHHLLLVGGVFLPKHTMKILSKKTYHENLKSCDLVSYRKMYMLSASMDDKEARSFQSQGTQWSIMIECG